MSKKNITRAVTTDDGRVLIEQPGGSFKPAESKTDWTRVDALTDTEINAAVASDPDAAPVLDEDWFNKARLAMPEPKAQLTIRLDRDLLSWLKSQGSGYQTRINAILRTYMDAHRPKP